MVHYSNTITYELKNSSAAIFNEESRVLNGALRRLSEAAILLKKGIHLTLEGA